MLSSKYNKAFRLENKVAVITAATSGIGLAIAERLGHEGARVVVSSRSEQNVARAVDQLVAGGLKADNVCGCPCHVARAEDRARLLQYALGRFGGRVHILVHNAGINPFFGDLMDVDESGWDKLFEVNVKAAFLMAKLFAPEIERSGGGAMLFNASIAGYRPMRGLAAYGVTKTALLGLTKALAEALAPRGIRVNALAPGIIRTQMSRALWECSDERASAEAIGTLIGPRLGDPRECAAVAAFLCSDDASYITGECVPVAGGAHSRL